MGSQAVHHHLLGLHVAQDNTLLALDGLARAADHDPAQHGDVFQQHVAQVDAAGEVQVAVNGGVAQVHVGGVQGDVAVHVAQGVVPRLVHGGADGPHQHGRQLAPGDVALGLEAAVGVAVQHALLHGRADEAPAPLAEGAGVGEAQGLAHGLLEHQVPGQEHRRLLPGDIGLRGRPVGRDALEVARVIGDVDIVRVPLGGGHVGKGYPRLPGVPVGAVDHGDQLRPGDGLGQVEVPADIAAHHAPLHQLRAWAGRMIPDGSRPSIRARHSRPETRRRMPPCVRCLLMRSDLSFPARPHRGRACPYRWGLYRYRAVRLGRPESWRLNTASRRIVSSSLQRSMNLAA